MIQIKTNSDRALVDEIKEKIRKNNGHCCCAITFDDDNKCMCKEFRSKIEKQEAGFCDCGLYELIITKD